MRWIGIITSKGPLITFSIVAVLGILVLSGNLRTVKSQEAGSEEMVLADFASVNAPLDEAVIAEGKAVYFRKCVWCHGPEGAGDGPGADRLWPRPRSFVEGTFKIRQTDSGELPTDEDLFQTVTHGLPGSAMPPWGEILSEKERRAVVQFVKYELVTDRDFTDDEDEEFNLIPIAGQIPSSEESIARGREVFDVTGKCLECHGAEGRGDGNKTQKDEWGFPIFPADLRKCWNFRGNRGDPYNPENIFREVSTGLNGTPMPSFKDALTIEQRWDVANFVISLCEAQSDGMPLPINGRTNHPTIKFVLKSLYSEEGIPTDPDDPLWQEGTQRIYVGLAGQITHKPRNFVRLVDDVWVRSLYTDDEIGFLFEWDDRTNSVSDPEAIANLGRFRETSPAGDPIAYKYGKFLTNDSIAINFAAEWQDLTPPQKPRFIFGDKKNHIDSWKWDADGTHGVYTGSGWDNPLEKRPASDLKIAFSEFKNGRWRVMMVRSRETEDKENDVQFDTGAYIPTIYYLWDGHNGDNGLKMSISTFYYTFLVPPVPKSVYVWPFIILGGVVLGEIWLVGKIKEFKKNNGKT